MCVLERILLFKNIDILFLRRELFIFEIDLILKVRFFEFILSELWLFKDIG